MYQPDHVFLGGDAKLSSPFSSIGLELSESPSFEVSAEGLPNEFALGTVLLFCSFLSLFFEPWWEGYRPNFGGTQKNHFLPAAYAIKGDSMSGYYSRTKAWVWESGS